MIGSAMEPFARDKGEGTKKVIVASDSARNHSLRARSSKSLSSQRHNKNRAKTYNGYRITNSNTWQRGPVNLTAGNASMEKIPLGHYGSGNNSNNLYPGIHLDHSSNFSSNSRIAKFNATLFSSASHLTNQGSDIEEAMDIDHQEINDEGVGFEGNSTSVLQEGIDASRQLGAPVEDQPLEHKIKIVVGESSSSGEKSKVSIRDSKIVGYFEKVITQ